MVVVVVVVSKVVWKLLFILYHDYITFFCHEVYKSKLRRPSSWGRSCRDQGGGCENWKDKDEASGRSWCKSSLPAASPADQQQKTRDSLRFFARPFLHSFLPRGNDRLLDIKHVFARMQKKKKEESLKLICLISITEGPKAHPQSYLCEILSSS